MVERGLFRPPDGDATFREEERGRDSFSAVRTLPSLILILAFALPAGALERGEITLEACHLDAPGAPRRPEAFCARTEVPEDHAAADGRRIALRVAVLPAISRDSQPDPLVLLAGGPGQASTEAFLPLLPALERVRRERDLVLIDQRGTGRLSPLSCDPASDVVNQPDPETVERLLSECLAEIGEGADPSRYTTAASVRDLDLVRSRLGYEQINLYGVSYGSRLAQLYTRHHPERVRSAVLDGVVPLDLVLGANVGTDAQRALDTLFARCDADEECRALMPDLGERLDAFIEQLENEPMTVSVGHPRTGEQIELELSRTVAAQILRLLVYAPETAALVPLLVDRATAGDASRFAAQWLVVSEGLGESINAAMSMSVSCSEDAPFFDEEAIAATAGASFLRDDVPRQLERSCALWPHEPVATGEKTPLESTVPILLLSGENDPVTPPAYGEQVLASLERGRHLVVPGMGHNVMARGCVPRLMADFVASADPEALDASCIEGIEPLPIFLSFTGPLAAADESAAGAEGDAAEGEP